MASSGAVVERDYAGEGYVGDFGPAAQKVIFEQGMVALTSNGILGDARPATAERGFAYRERMADMLADWIRERLP